MKTSFISTLAVQNAMRLTIQRGQSEIQTLQKEIVTGRHHDIGVALGASAGRSVALNREVQRLETIRDSNALVTQRLSASQLSLNLMSDNAQGMLDAFISLTGSDDATRIRIAKSDVANALDAFTDAVNSSSNGEYLFGGVNTDTEPLADYQAAGSAAKASFDAAFLGYFGFAQSSASAATITTAQMDDFLTNTLAPMFNGAQWNTDWSNASDTNITSRISANELVDSNANANADGMRSFALAAVIGLELLDTAIGEDVRALVNSRAIQHAGEAVTGIDNIRSGLGISQSRVDKANVSLDLQIKVVELHIGDLEGVDAYEASTRMSSLLAQVETSYQLTARLTQLSLTNFL
ncbi:flagellar hook-associated family protein [Pseudohoeflea coraliihabitans]|uniref:Flagellin n=1 Tax=Pseudohoeflea coraliihabitans TaxID=2860393 RepID=A0ABS6WN15_9HYPH|nr:flagellar hook-associated family protein [Pseudohoeflea sp. DP4N28-3]MBW3097352.1 flagellar hook-associated family protein [Pseudohoeflea sp. DP4N28-3]